MSKPAPPPLTKRVKAGPPLQPRDLFQLDSPTMSAIGGERLLMAFPFFPLTKGAWMSC